MYPVIFKYSEKLILRNWGFRFLTVFAVVGTTLYTIISQSNIFPESGSGIDIPTSGIPFMNIYIFNILLVLFVPLLTVALFFPTRTKDSTLVFLIYPGENWVYVVAPFFALIAMVFISGLIVLIPALMVNLFATLSPFDPISYLFYPLTLTLPTAIFIAGLSFAVSSRLQHAGLSLLVILLYFVVALFFLEDTCHGIFDPFSRTFPNLFSEITGHPGLCFYLIHRLMWVCLGIGLLFYAVPGYPRLPNKPLAMKRMRLLAVIILLVAIVCGSVILLFIKQDHSLRKQYMQTGLKYQEADKLNMLRQRINFSQEGGKMMVKTYMILQNKNTDPVDEIILYLNPGLQINEIRNSDQVLPFIREFQIVKLSYPVAPGEKVELYIDYSGTIDERICYSNIPEEQLKAPGEISFRTGRFGKHYAYLSDNLTLLTPESLWYPMSISYNGNTAYNVNKDFTDFTLTVNNPKEKVVVSQGSVADSTHIVTFSNDFPLTGLSLVIGDYKRFSIQADSVDFQLFLYPGHDLLITPLDTLKNILPELISSAKNNLETKKGRKYPYKRFTIVEVPVAFSSYFRPEKGGSELVQPEIMFIPEMGYNLPGNDFRSSLEAMRQYPQYMLGDKGMHVDIFNYFTDAFLGDLHHHSPRKWFSAGKLYNHSLRNSFSPSLWAPDPLFFNTTAHICSDHHPILDPVIWMRLAQSSNVRNPGIFSAERKWAVDYLSTKSLREAMHDPGISAENLWEIMLLKTEDLLHLLLLKGDVPPEETLRFIQEFTENRLFREIYFQDFNDAFIRAYGIDLDEIISLWESQVGIPAFLIGEVMISRVTTEMYSDGYISPYRLTFPLFNNSDTDGVVSIRMSAGGTYGYNYIEYIPLQAGRGKEVSLVVPIQPLSVELHTHLSVNEPWLKEIKPVRQEETSDTTNRILPLAIDSFLPPPGEYIVDNENEGFSIIQGKSRRKFSDLKQGHEVKVADHEKAAAAIMRRSKNQWIIYTDGLLQGLNKHRGVGKYAGNGESKLEWKVTLDTAGTYEIFAFIPGVNDLHQGYRATLNIGRQYKAQQKNTTHNGSSRPTVFSYYFTLVSDQEEIDVKVDISDAAYTWVSLGKYKLPAGEHLVRLSDKGAVETLVSGDAIKWKRIGENR